MNQPRKTGRPRKKTSSERQIQILEAALNIFAEKGFIKTTLSDISSQSGVPEASIYDLFSNKADILFRLAEQFFTDLRSNLHLHFLGIEGVVNRFRKLIWHHLHFFQEHPAFCRVFVLELMHNTRFLKSEASHSMKAYRREMMSLLEEGRKCREFGDMLDLKLCEIMVFGTMNHMMLSKIVLGKPLDFMQQAEDLYTIFYSAIAAQSYYQEETIRAETGKRRSILVAAMDEFVHKGFQQSTISRIARRAKVTEPTIYEHFTSKEELLYAIPRSAMREGSLVKTIDAQLENLDTPVNRLRHYISNYIRTIRDHADYYYLLISELRGNIGFYQSPTYQSMRDYASRLVWIIQDGVKSGDFKKDISVMNVRDLFFGLTDELIITLYVKKQIPEIICSFESVFNLIHNAIRC